MSARAPPLGPPPPPPPRQAPASASGWNEGFWTMFLGMWAAMAAMVGVTFPLADAFSGGFFWDDWILDAYGKKANAEPTRARDTTHKGNRRYTITFTYRDKRGRAYEATRETRVAAIIEAARAKKPFPVEYDPESPARVRFHGDTVSTLGLFILLPYPIAAALGLLTLRFAKAGRRNRRVYEHGRAVLAWVVSHDGSIGSEGHRAVWQFSYRFDGPTGPVFGQWATREPPPPGTWIWVLVDPADPARSVPAMPFTGA